MHYLVKLCLQYRNFYFTSTYQHLPRKTPTGEKIMLKTFQVA